MGPPRAVCGLLFFLFLREISGGDSLTRDSTDPSRVFLCLGPRGLKGSSELSEEPPPLTSPLLGLGPRWTGLEYTAGGGTPVVDSIKSGGAGGFGGGFGGC